MKENSEYEVEAERLDNELRPKLTPEFLDTLVQTARTYGHSGDYVEIRDFVHHVFGIAGRDISEDDLQPFQCP